MRLSLSTSTVRRSSESPHLTHTHFPRSPAPAQRTATDSMRAFAQTGSWSILAFKGDPGGLQMTLAAAGGGGCKDVAGMIVAGGCRSQASYLQSLRQRVSSRLLSNLLISCLRCAMPGAWLTLLTVQSGPYQVHVVPLPTAAAIILQVQGLNLAHLITQAMWAQRWTQSHQIGTVSPR